MAPEAFQPRLDTTHQTTIWERVCKGPLCWLYRVDYFVSVTLKGIGAFLQMFLHSYQQKVWLCHAHYASWVVMNVLISQWSQLLPGSLLAEHKSQPLAAHNQFHVKLYTVFNHWLHCFSNVLMWPSKLCQYEVRTVGYEPVYKILLAVVSALCVKIVWPCSLSHLCLPILTSDRFLHNF